VLYFLGIPATVVSFTDWVATLFLGRRPQWTADFPAGFLDYSTRVNVYAFLLVESIRRSAGMHRTIPSPSTWHPVVSTGSPCDFSAALDRLTRRLPHGIAVDTSTGCRSAMTSSPGSGGRQALDLSGGEGRDVR
jgi:hypothetical protein